MLFVFGGCCFVGFSLGGFGCYLNGGYQKNCCSLFGGFYIIVTVAFHLISAFSFFLFCNDFMCVNLEVFFVAFTLLFLLLLFLAANKLVVGLGFCFFLLPLIGV